MANVPPTAQGLVFREDEVIRFKLGDVEYAALQGIEQKKLQIPHFEERSPCTVIPTSSQHVYTKTNIADWLDKLEDQDDVSHAQFRKHLLFCGRSHGNIQLGKDLREYLNKERIRYWIVELVPSLREPAGGNKGFVTSPIQGGPYLLANRRLCAIYRLYDDVHGAFLQGLRPSLEDKTYIPFRVAGDPPLTYCVAVPTRHRCPLLDKAIGSMVAKRIFIKDIFEMQGLKISACNQDYLHLSKPARTTAPVIQRLMDRGGVIVGKARLSSMISREEPSESLDYKPPMNPRGDGKQSPAGSSSGSAAGVAAYEWVDFGIGSDSTGSARRPAMANGVYGLRVTTKVLPSEGIMPCFPIFDSPAVFTRNLKGLKSFVDLWCNHELETKFTAPTSIIVCTDFRVQNSKQKRLLRNFVTGASACFELPISYISIKKLWADSPPLESAGTALEEYLLGVGKNSFFYDFHATTHEFRRDWQRKHGNSRPRVNIVTGWRWDEAERIAKEERDDAVRRLDVYRDWLRERVFKDENPIMILPIHNAEECYRDDPPKERHPLQQAYDQLWLAPVLGGPELTVPIGQVPYFSRISREKEWLPVVASLLGKPRADLSLIDIAIRALEYADIPTRVAAGKQMWEPGCLGTNGRSLDVIVKSVEGSRERLGTTTHRRPGRHMRGTG